MIKKYNWKYFAVAATLTIMICVGVFLYNRWDIHRFNESLGKDSTQVLYKQESTEEVAEQTVSEMTFREGANTLETSKQQKPELKTADKGVEDTKDASFEDFLGFLDELDDEELAALLASLDLTDAEKGAFGEILQQQSENTAKADPSSMVVEMIESGVATLAGLIDLMEASTSTMSESGQERFQPVLEQLQTLHANGGKLAVYRPPDNPSGWYLIYLNMRRPLLEPDMIRRELESAGIIPDEDIDKIIDKVRKNETEFFLELNDGNTTTIDDSNTTIIE